jgi:DNA polymerase-3 subunit beta
VLDAKQLLACLKSKTDELVLIASYDEVVTVDGMQIESFSPDDYPAPPAVSGNHMEMSSRQLQSIIDCTVFAASSYDNGVLSAVNFDLPGKDQVVATDGSRMSLVKDVAWTGEPIKALIPATVLSKIIQPLLKQTNSVFFTLLPEGRQVLAIVGDNWTVITRLIDGEYPRYDELFPQEDGKTITFDKPSLLSALKQLKPFIDKRTNLITVEPINNIVMVDDQHKTSMKCNLSPQLDKFAESNVVMFAANYNYLLQAVESIDSDRIQVQFGGPFKPLIFSHGQYRHLLMPLQNKEIESAVKARAAAIKEAANA